MKDGENSLSGDDHLFTVTWMGAASLVFRLGDEILAVDPFLTRPNLRQLLTAELHPDTERVRSFLPQCSHILVSHAHHDHLMDVPAVMAQTGTDVFAPPNACNLLEALDVDPGRIHCIQAGEKFTLGAFDVEVVTGHHIWLPLPIFGKLPARLHHPPRFREYRMDVALAFLVTAKGVRFAVAPAEPVQADILFAYPYAVRKLWKNMQHLPPVTVVPIHWDNFFRPLSPQDTCTGQLERLNLRRFVRLAGRYTPSSRVEVILPFQSRPVRSLVHQ
jgi:L-ascorbate metabolism protein UlaG (beta-lactamase superfamily)